MNFRLTPFAFAVISLAFCAPATSRVQQPKKSSTTQARNPQKVSNPLNDALDAAQAAIDKKDFLAAATALKKFLAEKPEIAYAHFQLAYAYAGLEQWDDAKSEYQRAIALDSKMAEAYLNLGLLLVDREPVEAVAPLRAAVDLLPAQSRPRFLLGWALERSGDLEGALEPYQAAERLDPQDYEATFALGRTLLRLKRAPEAEKEFRKAVALRGDSAPAKLGLANALFVQDKPEAAEAFASYLELRPEDRESRRQLARLWFERREFEKALAELDRADAGAPPGSDSLRLRADILIGKKDWDAAIGVLQTALQQTPRDAALHAGLGRILLQKRDFPSAEKELRTALGLDEQLTDALRDLGAAYYLAGDYPAALQVLDLLAKRETPAAGSWFVRAICYDKLGQRREAVEAYEKFLQLDHDSNADQDFQARHRIQLLNRELGLNKR
ncbi:MAG TPA: tetratricopeptide repeat protein [Candidatus Acidoferrales bacterium]|nr:tetratricopeptide repeat protein [Candidatus Acidoferrales bacterium]